jgi:hypothetical protein
VIAIVAVEACRYAGTKESRHVVEGRGAGEVRRQPKPAKNNGLNNREVSRTI